MTRFKISTRLFFLIGFSALVMLIMTMGGQYGQTLMSASLDTLYEDRTLPLGVLSNVQALILDDQLALIGVVANPTPEDASQMMTGMQRRADEFDKQWTIFKSRKLTSSEHALAQSFEAHRKQFMEEVATPIEKALRLNDFATANQIYVEKQRLLYEPLRKNLADLNELQLTEAKSQYDLAHEEAVFARSSAWICLFLSAIVSGGFGVLLVRGISRSLWHAMSAAKKVAKGDLSFPIHIEGKDELADLLTALSEMQKSLGEVVSTVRHGSEAVANASSEIAQGNHNLSARTESQASTLEQTAASMEELTATVRQNADSAQTANQLAMNAATVAQHGGEVVGQVVQTMKEINDDSRKIQDIISVIDGIAFQTNILALNAAVEAARAGEQGRGFAVVASEVRSLAGRSAAAAREIKTLINASVERVEQGTALVDQAGNTMGEVVNSIQRVTDLMREISSASAEQSAGASQIGDAVTEMDQVTQQNAALVEEMAAAASGLKSQAEELVQTVSVFTLAQGNSSKWIQHDHSGQRQRLIGSFS